MAKQRQQQKQQSSPPRGSSCACRLCCICCGLGSVIVATIVGFVWWHFGRIILGAFRGESGLQGINGLQGIVNGWYIQRCPDKSTFDPNITFPWTVSLREKWQVIRDELYAWEQRGGKKPRWSDVDPLQEGMVQERNGDWSMLLLKFYGQWTEVSEDFPETVRLLKSTTASTAMLSVLDGKSSLREHRGDWRGVLRYHLALEVPPPSPSGIKDKLALRIREPFLLEPGMKSSYRELVWAEGEHLLFDDTFLHAVVHQREGRRIVLFIDVPREDCGMLLNLFTRIAVYHVVPYLPRVADIFFEANTVQARLSKRKEGKAADL